MAQAIFNVLFNFISLLANTLLAPINGLVNTLIPNVSSAITSFNEVITLLGGNAIDYIIHLIPPVTLSIIKIYLTFLITYYTISISIHAILKVWTIIKNIKIW